MTKQYDGIVIGAGQAGVPLATALAKNGWRTAIVERGYVGGTCVNRGCTPTKTMIANARVAHLARRAQDYGVHTGPVDIDYGSARQRAVAIVEQFRKSNRESLQNTEGLDLIFGEARFTGPKTLRVKTETENIEISAENIFINAGARAQIPPVDGIDDVTVLTEESLLELDTVPEHLVILGGGYIGLEFGQMFRRFGSQVTVVELGEQVLAREDADIAGEITDILREDGITIHTGTKLTAVGKAGDGHIKFVLDTPDGETRITGSHFLAAAGRTPNTDKLGLEAAGVETDDSGHIKVNDRLETNTAGIYALGDVKGGPAFTHISYDDFRIIRTNLLQGGEATIKDRLVPYTLFTDPQLGRVGMTESEARQQKRDILIARMPMSRAARAIETAETRGLMKVVIDANTGLILGCAMLGVQGGEMMSMIKIAMMGNLPYTALRDGVFAHPTFAESLNNLFANVEQPAN